MSIELRDDELIMREINESRTDAASVYNTQCRGDKFYESVFLNLCHTHIHIHHTLLNRSDYNGEGYQRARIICISRLLFHLRRINCVSQVSAFKFEADKRPLHRKLCLNSSLYVSMPAR